MEGVTAAAQEFLADQAAVDAALKIDRRRRSELGELRDAFVAFRDADETLTRLAERLAPGLTATHEPEDGAPINLWGFENEEERVFGARLAEAGSRLPEVDLGSVFRSYVLDAPQDDEERIQLLLAFSEFVASLDARGSDDDPRLGVGPAANFLTFAWHCLSSGKEPVFSFGSTRAIRAIADGIGLGADVRGDLETRYRTFYKVARALQRELGDAPKIMRAGWAVEHALAWILERFAGSAQVGDDFGRSGVWQPRDRAELRAALGEGRPVIEGPRSGGAVSIEPPRRAKPSEPELSAPEPDLTELTPATAARRSRFLDIARKRVVQPSDSGKIVDVTGMDLEDALPPDRTEDDVPYFARQSPRAREIEAEEDRRRELKKKAETRRIRRQLAEERQAAAAQPRVEAPAPPRAPEGAPPSAPPPAPPPPVDVRPTRREEPVRERSVDARPTRREEADSGRLTALLNEFRGEVIQTSQKNELGTPASDRLARDLYLDPDRWGALLDALGQQRAVLLVGPTASGKTYVARRLALHLAGREERVLFLRVHPELGYEHVMGSRGAPGLVRAHCEQALEDKERVYVLVLDELDRGDAARSLGEFTGGLSERGQEVRLACGDLFAVPRNLRVIATARTLPHDPALLGRFPVVRWPADPEVLRRFLAHRRPGVEQVADLFAALRDALDKRGLRNAVGHGLLMDPELEVTRVRGRWAREVIPLLESLGIDADGLGYDDLRRG